MCRVDYSKFHYCKTCEIKYPLDVFRCIDPSGCGMKIRVVPRKQKRKVYVPVPTEECGKPWKISRELKEIRVQCMTTNPVKEVRH